MFHLKKVTCRGPLLLTFACFFLTGISPFAQEKEVSTGNESKELELVLNLDFYDMIYLDPPYCKGVENRDGHYSREQLEGLITRAADSGFSIINFRVAIAGKVAYRSSIKDQGDDHPEISRTLQAYDPLALAIDSAHKNGIKCYVWMTPFDDSGAVKGYEERGRGIMQSKFSWLNPQYQLLSRDGDDPLWGVYSFGHPEVVDYWISQIHEILAYQPDGIFFSDRTHSNMSQRQIEYGFNPPVIERYQVLHGGDPRDRAHYDLGKFSSVQGDFYTDFLREAARHIRGAGARFMVKVSWRQEDSRIAYRLGSLDKSFFQWEKWIEEGIIDALVIGGDAATGTGPEFVLPYFDTEAEISRPDYFREKPHSIPLYRWLTLQDWAWPTEEDKVVNGRGAKTFKKAIVRRMLTEVQKSRVNGVLMHEALVIDSFDHWDLYEEISSPRPK